VTGGAQPSSVDTFKRKLSLAVYNDIWKIFFMFFGLLIPSVGLYAKGIMMESHRGPRKGKVCHRKKWGQPQCSLGRPN